MRRIRLTESQIARIISNSVRRIIREAEEEESHPEDKRKANAPIWKGKKKSEEEESHPEDKMWINAPYWRERLKAEKEEKHSGRCDEGRKSRNGRKLNEGWTEDHYDYLSNYNTHNDKATIKRVDNAKDYLAKRYMRNNNLDSKDVDDFDFNDEDAEFTGNQLQALSDRDRHPEKKSAEYNQRFADARRGLRRRASDLGDYSRHPNFNAETGEEDDPNSLSSKWKGSKFNPRNW